MTTKIPTCLKELNQWVLWKEKKRSPTDEKPTKIPHQTNGLPAKPNDATTWASFEQIEKQYLLGSWTGMGFVFTESDPFCGIDLDGCRNPETGEVAEWARKIVKAFDSYTEVSPSETGVKIFIRGESPFGTGRKIDLDEPKVCDKNPGIEVYDRKRYFAVTGLRLGGISTEVESRQGALEAHCCRWFPDSKSKFTPTQQTSVTERAARYLDKMPPAISGQSGHNTAFRTACVLVKGFGLSIDEAYPLFCEWNQTCEPPWSEREIRHKLESAAKASGEIGYLRDVSQNRWADVVVPNYTLPDEAKPLPKRQTLESAALDYIEKVNAGELELTKLGVGDLDAAIGGGVLDGELIIVGARPGHGKSTIGLQITHAIGNQGKPCLVISEEMSQLALGKRAIQFASETHEEDWRERSPVVAQDVKKHFLGKAPCYISESVGTSERAVEVIRDAVANDGVKVVVMDYAQLLRSKGNGRYEQVTNTSIAFRQLTTELNIIFILLAQLNREVDGRDKWIPRMGDLKDSGQLEQDADVVIFLLWRHRLNPSHDPHEYTIFVSKNRSRPIHKPVVNCEFRPSRQMIGSAKDGEVREIQENRYWDDDDGDF